MKICIRNFTFSLGLAVSFFFFAGIGRADTFTVNSTGDPGDGVCDSIECTLREAIDAANANPGPDVIEFAIGAGGPQTITPTSLLPHATQTIRIDGRTQPGFTGAPLITIDAAAPGTGLFLLNAAGSTIRAIEVVNAQTAGVQVEGGSGNVVENVTTSWSGPQKKGVGVSYYQSSHGRIEQVTALNREQGVSVFFADATLIQNNRLSGAGIGISAGGLGNRFFNNDLSFASSFPISVTGDTQFEIAGNDFSHSANGLYLFNIDGLIASPNPGPGRLDIDVGTVAGIGLFLETVRNSKFSGLDLSWHGAVNSGKGVFENGGFGNALDHLVAKQRQTGVETQGSSGNTLSDLDLSWAGVGQNGVGVSIYQCANTTIQNVLSPNRQVGIGIFFADSTLIQNNSLAGAVTGISAGGNGNKFFNNDVSSASGYSLSVSGDNQFEISGNDFSNSANGLSLFNIDGLVASPNPGPGQIDMDVSSIPGIALTLASLRNSHLSGLDLSWNGQNVAGWSVPPDGNRGIFAPGCPDTTISATTVRNRDIGMDIGAPNFHIDCDILERNRVGVRVHSDQPGMTIQGCLISANTSYGLLSFNTANLVLAENNFWGAANGPRPSGSGDLVQGNVDAFPFLTGPSLCTAGNSPPSVGPIVGPPTPVGSGTQVVLGANFADPNTTDLHTAFWNWGDGTSSAGEIDESNGSGTAAGAHTYTTPGVYTVTLTVTDSLGATDNETFQYAVVYSPDGGFVTGGGWITSPAGACPMNPALAGRANFGFISKYQKGASVPTGDTEFQFKAGDLNFKSRNYEWLVVAGANAKYKGTGTINGLGNYGFMLTATDGQVNGGGDVDKFRIKIWDKNNGEAVVYDNKPGASDDSYSTQELSGGSIVVHK